MTAEQQAPEVRLGDDGSLDEVVGPGFHLEQMDTNHWWLRIESAGVSGRCLAACSREDHREL